MRTKRCITLLTLPLFFIAAHAQHAEIGKAVGNDYEITADTAILVKALQRTTADGTRLHALRIESVKAFHYLVGTGVYHGYPKMIAVRLVYDANKRTFSAAPGLGYVTCSAAACNDCRPFKENGRIMGCKCEEHATVSNQCNFTEIETSQFYEHFQRFLALKKH